MEDVRNSKGMAPLSLAGKAAMDKISGSVAEGERSLFVLMTGQRLQLVELQLKEGFYRPSHKHPEHESMGYVVSGRLEMMIDGKTYILGPGDAWHHRIGVPHATRALVDTVAVELHAPPRPELVAATQG